MKRRSFASRLHQGERGAVGTIFAVLLLGGVVMSMLALTVDVGNIWSERRQLQNGADAASLALASACAKNSTSPACSTDPTTNGLQTLAGNNAVDNLAGLDPTNGQGKICFRGTSGISLPGPLCTDPGAFQQLTKCPPLPSWLTADIPFVETSPVTKSTASNPTILPKYFSQLLAGGGPNVAETACARAAWGTPGSYTASIPITMSVCAWQAETANGTDWVQDQPVAPKPGYGGVGQPSWPSPSKEIVVLVHNPNDAASSCDWNGKQAPGGFGWVTQSGCSALVSTDGWVQIDTGNNVPQDCKTILPGLVGTVVSIPVFDCIVASQTQPLAVPTDPALCNPTQKQTSGNNAWYHIKGWALFYVSGYRFSGGSAGSILPGGATSCTTSTGNGDRCLFGWFLKGVLDSSSITPPSSGSDFGTYGVVPAG